VLALAALEIADRKRVEITNNELNWENLIPREGNKKAYEFFMKLTGTLHNNNNNMVFNFEPMITNLILHFYLNC
jgi:hypothetical protein